MVVVETSTSASPREEHVHLLFELALPHLPVGDEERAGVSCCSFSATSSIGSTRCAGRTPGRRARPRARALPSPFPRRTRLPSFGWAASFRRRLDDRDVAQPGERHVQRARDRRGADVNTSTSRRSARSSSFCATPKRCSSSRITSPSSLGITSRLSTRCVPISTSTLPSRKSASTCLTSFGGRKRETISTRTGKSR